MGMEEVHDWPILEILRSRDGQTTGVQLEDGRPMVWNIAWGYDMGENSAHVTSNVSPFVDGASLDVFWTNEVLTITDVGSSEVLFSRG